MKQSSLLLVVCWVSMWEHLSFLQEVHQQNRQPEIIRLAVALINVRCITARFWPPTRREWRLQRWKGRAVRCWPAGRRDRL